MIQRRRRKRMDDLFRVEEMGDDEVEFSFDVGEFEALGLDADYIRIVFNHTDSWAHA
jgi:hypothetical protein